MNSETSNKIVVIGAGNVGETICYTLMLRAQVGEIVLIDVNEKKAKGALPLIFPMVLRSTARSASSRAAMRSARTRRSSS